MSPPAEILNLVYMYMYDVYVFHQIDEYWSTYGTPLSACSKKTVRRFPKAAEKVLDAPNLINDFCESNFTRTLSAPYTSSVDMPGNYCA